SSSVEFIVVNSAAELLALEEKLKQYPVSIGKRVEFSQLQPEIKWRSYYQDQNSVKYKNIVPLSTYGKVVRGIATGANNYFTFNTEKQKQHGIRDEFLLPCITKSNDVSGSFFTKQHVENLKLNGKNIFLLNAKDTKDKNVEQYIQFGEDNNIHKKHLTSHRNPWYILEYRPPSPIWVSVFNRKGLRFIRNEAGISNLTTFHCMYLNMSAANRADLLFAYLLTDVSRQIFNDNRREYGNGLEKFEPNDLNHSKVVDLDKVDLTEEQEIIKTLNKYRDGVLSNNEDINLLDKLNDLFLTVLTK
ncbi:MAG: SAM-dependent DNA methyltransferase, partial [Bacteroidota bacterium]|nr:SAM-dependent DNA methyltransferase [Bacteroidota bacterium]